MSLLYDLVKRVVDGWSQVVPPRRFAESCDGGAVMCTQRVLWLAVTRCDIDITRLHIGDKDRSPVELGDRELFLMCNLNMSTSQHVTTSHRYLLCSNTVVSGQ